MYYKRGNVSWLTIPARLFSELSIHEAFKINPRWRNARTRKQMHYKQNCYSVKYVLHRNAVAASLLYENLKIWSYKALIYFMYLGFRMKNNLSYCYGMLIFDYTRAYQSHILIWFVNVVQTWFLSSTLSWCFLWPITLSVKSMSQNFK